MYTSFFLMAVAAADLEAAAQKPKFQTEPTFPIYLKVCNMTASIYIYIYIHSYIIIIINIIIIFFIVQ